MNQSVRNSARQAALTALHRIQKGAFADEALHQVLAKTPLSSVDRYFTTELVYGTTRRQRTLDALIQRLSASKGDRPPLLIQIILQLGLYQLRYLDQVPASAAVNTAVELAKANQLGGLAGFVNGVLRSYVRQEETILAVPDDPVVRLGILHSYPDWIVQVWANQLVHPDDAGDHAGNNAGGEPLSRAQAVSNAQAWSEVETLCEWFNQPPSIDLRVNPLLASVEHVQHQLEANGIATERLPAAPQSLRLTQHHGAIQSLPGYAEGWWSVQDGSAQLVSQLLDPQPGDSVIDACAAPGGKTTHMAELMGDRGTIWACDRHAKRLQRIDDNLQRLRLQSITLLPHDMRSPHDDLPQADRVLVDAPCSGLGTLHRHADARWRQSSNRIESLAALQTDLLRNAARYVKPGGMLVYATCTLHPTENEAVVTHFLQEQASQWAIAPVSPESLLAPYQTAQGWLKVWPHHHHLDGFFMVRLQKLS